MPRIIVKSPYLKPSDNAHLQNYIEYIATRHGVERPEDPRNHLPATSNQLRTIGQLTTKYPDVKELFEYEDYRSAPNQENAGELILAIADAHPELFESRDGYIQYMAHRPGVQKLSSHGLFSSSNEPLDLQKIQNDIQDYPGNVWTHIVSLRREDAARLGYDHAEQWRELLRKNQLQIAAAMKIHPENFRWYAAFHNESHHPHVHMVAYSTDSKEAYLSTQGIRQIKSVLARDIFHDDLLNLYQEQTYSRDNLRRESSELLTQLSQSSSASPVLSKLMEELSLRLQNTKGKKVYGYLSAGTKKLVDAIVDELARDERIAALYGAWYEQQNEIVRTYRDKLPERIPLSQNKEFKTIRNAVVKTASSQPIEDEDGLPEDPEPAYSEYDWQPSLSDSTPSAGRTSSKSRLWTEEYKAARAVLYGDVNTFSDPEKALARKKAALLKNQDALYALGKLLLDRSFSGFYVQNALSCLEFAVQEYRDANAAYLLGRTYAKGELVPKDMEKALPYLFSAANAGNLFALYQLGRIYFYGDGVLPDPDLAVQLLNASAAQGNPFALRLLDRIAHPSGPDYSAYALSSAVSLLRQAGRIFQKQLGYEQESQLPLVDSKLRQKIAEKMAAHGQQLT